ncbi:MAG: pyrroloquinoline quinone biosynthesis protein PqqB [Gammaproteobacteria bacterium]|nr:pyrroloquinoline quinone biosynthesis protein PqqB [Gammaproteobacteria bacterium]MBV8306413.1 pyrroloquinoline quinone biosynthesis protein PqqB [Gammaproteobacteria bacterium]MBV8404276.1 pyrroloquinoline quinone biosynthesis protein PqqB [Gammaproteobacteria bacterium]
MKVRVLGSAAGGGFPQWNCNCRNCTGVRRRTLRATPRTQSSIAVCGRDGRSWALINASPDILAQLRASPALQGTAVPRDSAIGAIVLVDGQIDHTAGLLLLRESGRPLAIWCTDEVCADLSHGYPVFGVLAHYCGVERRGIVPDGSRFAIPGVTGVLWRALAVAGKPAPYSPHRDAPVRGDNIALIMEEESSARTIVYAPGVSAMQEDLWQAMQGASAVLVDGTFWSDDEMPALGIAHKRARDLGHLPQSGAGGMLEWLGRLPADSRRILVHVNNTNPILDEDSPQRAELDRRGIEVAWDGLEIEL